MVRTLPPATGSQWVPVPGVLARQALNIRGDFPGLLIQPDTQGNDQDDPGQGDDVVEIGV